MIWFLTKKERVSLRRAISMLEIDKRGFAAALFLGVAGLGAAIGLAATSAWLIARASQMPPVLTLSVAAVTVRMFGIMRALFRYLQRLASHKVALAGMDSLRLNIYDSLSTGPIDRVARLQRGDILARTGADVDTVGDFVVKSLLPVCVTTIVALGTVVGFFFLSPLAALVLAICLLLSGVVGPALTMRSTRLGQIAEEESKRQLSMTSMTIIDGADELRVDGRYSALLKQLNDSSDNLNYARSKAAKPAALAAMLDRVSMGIAVIGIMLVSIPQVDMGLVSAVALAVLVLTPLAAFEGTAELGAAAAGLVRSAQAAVRINDLLGPPVAEPKTHQVPHLQSPIIEAKNLSIGWDDKNIVASGFSFTIEPGQKVAIVGPSGIGKTTLLYTLAGMLKPCGGEAMLNQVPAWNADREEVAKYVSLTTEDSHIFATSVYENLRVANGQLTQEDAENFLKRMGLGLWLEGLPHGMETQLGAGGTSISGGERRRLLLARALASKAPIMLLDEPGEHLDAKTADQILHELLIGTESERGILLVTHRLSELSMADKVLVLDDSPNGATIISQGNHDELLSSSSSYRWAAEQEK